MRAHDLRIKFPRRVDVVIVSRDSGVLELARFDRSNFAEGNANFHAEPADFTNRLNHTLKLFRAIAHPAPGRAHAESRGALRASALRGGKDFFDRQQFLALESGRIMG